MRRAFLKGLLAVVAMPKTLFAAVREKMPCRMPLGEQLIIWAQAFRRVYGPKATQARLSVPLLLRYFKETAPNRAYSVNPVAKSPPDTLWTYAPGIALLIVPDDELADDELIIGTEYGTPLMRIRVVSPGRDVITFHPRPPIAYNLAYNRGIPRDTVKRVLG